MCKHGGKKLLLVNDKGDVHVESETRFDDALVGDEVTFKGKLTLKKNFGSGYFYEVIMEDAVLINKSSPAIQL